jgi:hypothetical protein
MKQFLANAVALVYPDFSKPFITIPTDASKFKLGAFIS